MYEPPERLLQPCTPPVILPLNLAEAMTLNYQRYKTSDKLCRANHQALLDWYRDARKKIAERNKDAVPAVVK